MYVVVLKLIFFHWDAQAVVLDKSLFKSLANFVKVSHTKNRNVISVKNSGLDAKSSNKSLMYFRKK